MLSFTRGTPIKTSIGNPVCGGYHSLYARTGKHVAEKHREIAIYYYHTVGATLLYVWYYSITGCISAFTLPAPQGITCVQVRTKTATKSMHMASAYRNNCYKSQDFITNYCNRSSSILHAHLDYIVL